MSTLIPLFCSVGGSLYLFETLFCNAQTVTITRRGIWDRWGCIAWTAIREVTWGPAGHDHTLLSLTVAPSQYRPRTLHWQLAAAEQRTVTHLLERYTGAGDNLLTSYADHDRQAL